MVRSAKGAGATALPSSAAQPSRTALIKRRYGFAIVGQAARVTPVFIKGPSHCRNKDGVTMQPGVHISHSIHTKAGLLETSSDVLCALLDGRVLLRNLAISNDAAVAISGDARKCKHGPTWSDKRQQLAGDVGVVSQEYHPRNCGRPREVRKDAFDLFAAHGDKAHVCGEIGRQSVQNGQKPGGDPHRLCVLDRGALLVKLFCPVWSSDQSYLVIVCRQPNSENGALNACAYYDDFQCRPRACRCRPLNRDVSSAKPEREYDPGDAGKKLEAG